uniref:RING-type domain-containing protein n=1 Tax=Macrostomum lignano TaxID=282301 RepID=A0A1I8JLX7_9PLAT
MTMVPETLSARLSSSELTIIVCEEDMVLLPVRVEVPPPRVEPPDDVTRVAESPAPAAAAAELAGGFLHSAGLLCVLPIGEAGPAAASWGRRIPQQSLAKQHPSHRVAAAANNGAGVFVIVGIVGAAAAATVEEAAPETAIGQRGLRPGNSLRAAPSRLLPGLLLLLLSCRRLQQLLTPQLLVVEHPLRLLQGRHQAGWGTCDLVQLLLLLPLLLLLLALPLLGLINASSQSFTSAQSGMRHHRLNNGCLWLLLALQRLQRHGPDRDSWHRRRLLLLLSLLRKRRRFDRPLVAGADALKRRSGRLPTAGVRGAAVTAGFFLMLLNLALLLPTELVLASGSGRCFAAAAIGSNCGVRIAAAVKGGEPTSADVEDGDGVDCEAAAASADQSKLLSMPPPAATRHLTWRTRQRRVDQRWPDRAPTSLRPTSCRPRRRQPGQPDVAAATSRAARRRLNRPLSADLSGTATTLGVDFDADCSVCGNAVGGAAEVAEAELALAEDEEAAAAADADDSRSAVTQADMMAHRAAAKTAPTKPVCSGVSHGGLGRRAEQAATWVGVRPPRSTTRRAPPTRRSSRVVRSWQRSGVKVTAMCSDSFGPKRIGAHGATIKPASEQPLASRPTIGGPESTRAGIDNRQLAPDARRHPLTRRLEAGGSGQAELHAVGAGAQFNSCAAADGQQRLHAGEIVAQQEQGTEFARLGWPESHRQRGVGVRRMERADEAAESEAEESRVASCRAASSPRWLRAEAWPGFQSRQPRAAITATAAAASSPAGRGVKARPHQTGPGLKQEQMRVLGDELHCHIGQSLISLAQGRPAGAQPGQLVLVRAKPGIEWLAGLSLGRRTLRSDQYQLARLRSRWSALSQADQRLANVTVQLVTEHSHLFLFEARASLVWPSLYPSAGWAAGGGSGGGDGGSRLPRLELPVTQVGKASTADLILENPTDKTTPPPHRRSIRLTPTPRWATEYRRLPVGYPDIHPDTLAVLIRPRQRAHLPVTFRPTESGEFRALFLLRNNLTGVEPLLAVGRGARVELRASADSMEFGLAGATGLEPPCQRVPPSIWRQLTIVNPGPLTVDSGPPIVGRDASGCSDAGFMVAPCAPIRLGPNESLHMAVTFTPDLCQLRTTRELRLVGGALRVVLRGGLTPTQVAACSARLPRPPPLQTGLVGAVLAAALWAIMSACVTADRLSAASAAVAASSSSASANSASATSAARRQRYRRLNSRRRSQRPSRSCRLPTVCDSGQFSRLTAWLPCWWRRQRRAGRAGARRGRQLVVGGSSARGQASVGRHAAAASARSSVGLQQAAASTTASTGQPTVRRSRKLATAAAASQSTPSPSSTSADVGSPPLTAAAIRTPQFEPIAFPQIDRRGKPLPTKSKPSASKSQQQKAAPDLSGQQPSLAANGGRKASAGAAGQDQLRRQQQRQVQQHQEDCSTSSSNGSASDASSWETAGSAFQRVGAGNQRSVKAASSGFGSLAQQAQQQQQSAAVPTVSVRAVPLQPLQCKQQPKTSVVKPMMTHPRLRRGKALRTCIDEMNCLCCAVLCARQQQQQQRQQQQQLHQVAGPPTGLVAPWCQERPLSELAQVTLQKSQRMFHYEELLRLSGAASSTVAAARRPNDPDDDENAGAVVGSSSDPVARMLLGETLLWDSPAPASSGWACFPDRQD